MGEAGTDTEKEDDDETTESSVRPSGEREDGDTSVDLK